MIVIVLALYYGAATEPTEMARSIATFDTIEACEIARAAAQPHYRRVEALASARAGVPATLRSTCVTLPQGVAL